MYPDRLQTLLDQGRLLMHRQAQESSDLINPLCMLLLSITGILFIYSAQSYDQGTQWQSQIVWVLLGGIAYLLTSLINYRYYFQNAHYIYLAGTLLLVPLALDAITPFDLPLIETRYGSTRWINLGVLSVQPSELAKIGTLLLLASALARNNLRTARESLYAVGEIGMIACIPFFLIFLQPDLGSALVFPPVCFALLFVSRLPRRFFVAAFALFAMLLAVVAVDLWSYTSHFRKNNLDFSRDTGAYETHSWMPLLKDYQRNRILTFVAPELVDPRGIGVSWNQRQSNIAVATGGMFGKGLFQGTQATLGYLPKSVATNDFIWSVLAEEIGFAGGACVIGLFALLMANTLRIGSQSRDRFGLLLCVGVSVIFMVHVCINIGMTIGLMPITGLPLPFLSSGGSFMIACCVLQGMVQSVHRFRKDFH